MRSRRGRQRSSRCGSPNRVSLDSEELVAGRHCAGSGGAAYNGRPDRLARSGPMRKPAALAVVTLITLAWLPQGALANSVAASWTTHGPDGGSVASFAIDPSRPRTVYAGTLYDGVFKS